MWVALWLLLSWTQNPLQGTTTVRHHQLTPDDRFILCAREVFSKPVLRDRAGPWLMRDVPCPASTSVMRAALEAEELRLLEFPDVVAVIPERWFGKAPNPHVEYMQMQWDRLRLVDSFDWWGERAAPGWSEADLQAVGRRMLALARPVPMLTPTEGDQGGAGGVATVHRSVSVQVTSMPGRGERVIGVLWNDPKHMGGSGRLVYAERRNGQLTLLWDSPLFQAEALQLGYSDLDRDGQEEVLVADGLGVLTRFTAFSPSGEELTRQTCRGDRPRFDLEPAAAYVCPIWASEVEIDNSVTGPKHLLVTAVPSRLDGDVPPKRSRYRLIDGRYRPPDAPK